MNMKRRAAATPALDPNGILPTNVKNFAPARTDGKPGPVDRPPQNLQPVTVGKPSPAQHRTSESHVERNTTNNSIRHQPLAEAKAMLPIVKWLAAPAGVLAFMFSFVNELHLKFIQQGVAYFPLKAAAVHIMMACGAGMFVGLAFFLLVWSFTSTGLGRTKIKEDNKTERMRIKAEAEERRRKVQLEHRRALKRDQAIAKDEAEQRQLITASLARHAQPQSHSNRLTTYRAFDGVKKVPNTVPIAELAPPPFLSHKLAMNDAQEIAQSVGDRDKREMYAMRLRRLFIQFTQQVYNINEQGDLIYIKPDGKVKRDVEVPWSTRALNNNRTMIAMIDDFLTWPQPWIWTKRDGGVWQINIDAYPSASHALKELDRHPFRRANV